MSKAPPSKHPLLKNGLVEKIPSVETHSGHNSLGKNDWAKMPPKDGQNTFRK